MSSNEGTKASRGFIDAVNRVSIEETQVPEELPETRPRTHLAAVLVALFVTVLWSSSWVLIRWGLDSEGLEPITFAAGRYGMAAVIVVG